MPLTGDYEPSTASWACGSMRNSSTVCSIRTISRSAAITSVGAPMDRMSAEGQPLKAGDTIGKAHSLNAHRDFGWALTQYGGLLLLLATLIAWQKPLRERVGLYVVLCLLGFPLQPVLAAAGEHNRFVGMFHPVNAILLLGLSATLARRAWATRRISEPALEAAPSTL